MEPSLPFHPSAAPLPVTSSAFTDVLQTIVALQACPTSCVPSTSTAMLSSSLPFPTTLPSLYSSTNPLGIQIDGIQSLLANPSLLPNSTVEALANALFATTSRRASCPEPPATSQATVNLPTDNLLVPTSSSASSSPERRRYSETNLDALIREQLAQMMPPTSQLPGMPGCYFQHVPAGIQGGIETATRMASGSHPSHRRVGHRKARTIYGTTQTQQLEDMFRGQMYVVGAERESLALRLGLSASQVRIWFQNRRSKHRRKQQEEQQTTSPEENKE